MKFVGEGEGGVLSTCCDIIGRLLPPLLNQACGASLFPSASAKQKKRLDDLPGNNNDNKLTKSFNQITRTTTMLTASFE